MNGDHLLRSMLIGGVVGGAVGEAIGLILWSHIQLGTIFWTYVGF